ncbi:hypothetical protein GDO78_004236 [Eleutherodactylus coqui]|uniref:Uncharacterized protein n=1 Tax=Eleutherodactylus coqui TaxID=57060 RepID=A0A8J6EQB0_ELECQ|nr:hypothetical protein GDO78_004236 [Eleutherodactylus coqui]
MGCLFSCGGGAIFTGCTPALSGCTHALLDLLTLCKQSSQYMPLLLLQCVCLCLSVSVSECVHIILHLLTIWPEYL